MPSGSPGLLSRASIRDKLNLLLLVPVLATALLAVPIVANQVDQARTYGNTANAVFHAIHVSDMLHALQRERLASVDYLTGGDVDRQALLLRQATVDNAVSTFHTDMASELPTDHVTEAMSEMRHLDRMRRGVLTRTAEPPEAYQVYSRIIEATVGALGMHHHNSDQRAPSRPLEIVDSVVRVNEQTSKVSAALLVMADDREAGRELLSAAVTLRQLHTNRFLAAADPPHIALIRAVDKASSTKALNRLVTQAREADKDVGQGFATETGKVTDSQTTLRELLVMRVVRDIHDTAVSRAEGATLAAWAVGIATSLVIVLVVAMGISVSRSIAYPVRKLTRAAGAVAALTSTELARVSDEEHVEHRTPSLTAIQVTSTDEVGELATAFNRVQTTAAMLLERQVQTRRNVGLMFASVARRTQNLVGGQLALIDELERNEQNPQLLAELYQLDHLSMRLRRSAESLLVVSGVRDETRLAVPAQLATVLRSALAEIEDFQRVRLVAVCAATVAPDAVPDVSLLLAELLENATSYSPPSTMVDVSAEYTSAGCRVTIADHGIGMSDEQIAEENRRFVQRERLDIAPTTMLGLFVVGRLARRHGLAVVLWPTSGGGITAVIDLPGRLLAIDPTPVRADPGRAALGAPVPEPRPAASVALVPGGSPQSSAGRALTATMSSPGGPGETFEWFPGRGAAAEPPDMVAAPPAPDSAVPASGDATSPAAEFPAAGGVASHGVAPQDPSPQRAGLTRRVPGARLGATAPPPMGDVAAPTWNVAPTVRDPERERDTFDGFASAVARAAADGAPPSPVAGEHSVATRPYGSGAPAEEGSKR